MQPDDPRQFDFMLNPERDQKKPLANIGNNKKLLLLVVALGSIVLIIIAIIVSALLSGGTTNNDRLLKIGAYQTEIDRVITLGQKNISDPEVKNKLGTFQVLLLSDKSQISTLFSGVDAETLKLSSGSLKSSTRDDKIEEALATNTHDSVLTQTVESLAEEYYSLLKDSKADISTKRGLAIIDTALGNVETLYSD